MDMQVRRAATKPLAINIDGDVLNIKYQPQRLTPAGVRDLQDTGKKLRESLTLAKEATTKQPTTAPVADVTEPQASITDDAVDGIQSALDELAAQIDSVGDLLDVSIEKIVSIVAEWDLVDDGVSVSITPEAIIEHDIDVPMMGLILRAIQEDQSVSPVNARNSGTRS